MDRELTRLEEALNELAEAQISREQKKDALELARATALLSGAIVGKNAEERDAQARTSLSEHYDSLRQAEERFIRARVRAELARAHFEVAKAIGTIAIPTVPPEELRRWERLDKPLREIADGAKGD